MIQTIIGLILLLMPFLFLFNFQNKILGFTYILSFFMASHLITSDNSAGPGEVFNYISEIISVHTWDLHYCNFKNQNLIPGFKRFTKNEPGYSFLWSSLFLFIFFCPL